MTFHPRREGRWEYASQTVEHIERYNCVHRCVHGAEPGSENWLSLGPGGSCDVLARVFTEPAVPELNDNGAVVMCTAFEQRPEPRPQPEPVPEGQLTIGDL